MSFGSIPRTGLDSGQSASDGSVPGHSAKATAIKDFIWPAIGIGAAFFCLHLLYGELRTLSFDELAHDFRTIAATQWAAAIFCTYLAYGALAWYDQISLRHLGHTLPMGYVALVSYVSYALSHNIGASAFSGALIRYRAYSLKGLSVGDVGIMVALNSLTYGLGVALIFGIVCLAQGGFVHHALHMPLESVTILGVALIGAVVCYALGSLLPLPTITLGKTKLAYPRPAIVLRQLIAGPLELFGAAGIIYCVLPDASNPGFLFVLGAFIISFSSALLSHAPGGLGVFEYVCLKALPQAAPHHLIVALLVFRLFYLLLPFAFSIIVVLWFERGALMRMMGIKTAKPVEGRHEASSSGLPPG